MSRKRIIGLSFALLAVIVCLVVFLFRRTSTEETAFYRNFKEIQQSGYIRVGILQNTTDYYLENSEIKGFHYDLAESFAKHTGLETRYIVYDTYWDNFFALLNDEVDFLAMDINSNYQRDVFFSYTQPHSYTTHVLVQRKSDLFFDKELNRIDSSERKLLLAIPAFSSFYNDALLLCYQTGVSTIDLQIKESLNTDYFLDLLNKGEINITIEDKKIMDANSLSYKNLNYSTVLTDTLPLYWAVNKGNYSLQKELNHWLDSLKKTQVYPILLKKYYSSSSRNRQKLSAQQRKLSNGSISVYDALIKKYAQRYELDWRLVAAIIHKESRFNPNAVGRGGSHGLMQLMPSTAARLNINDPYSIEGQIATGCKLLNRLINRYAEKGVTDSTDLYKFALAAYNAGHGRIDNAMLLTEAAGLNPCDWDNVQKILPKMSDKAFIKGAELNIKSYNGNRTKDYVSSVWLFYRHYQNMVEK